MRPAPEAACSLPPPGTPRCSPLAPTARLALRRPASGWPLRPPPCPAGLCRQAGGEGGPGSAPGLGSSRKEPPPPPPSPGSRLGQAGPGCVRASCEASAGLDSGSSASRLPAPPPPPPPGPSRPARERQMALFYPYNLFHYCCQHEASQSIIRKPSWQVSISVCFCTSQSIFNPITRVRA